MRMASLWQVGTIPVSKDVLIMLVMMCASMSKHGVTRLLGMGL